jgi:hypothetical protein
MLSFFEEYLRKEVYPMYANTHTLMSSTGLQCTLWREEARRLIHSCVNGTPDHVCV